MHDKKHSITLLFNANKVFDRQVIEGIGQYLQASNADWDVYLEEDFRWRLNQIKEWHGDGIIADFDDPEIRKLLENSSTPIVGVGGSYTDTNDYPKVPYVATDNYALVNAAYEHLKKKGIDRFAFYGLPDEFAHRWAKERETAAVKIAKKDGYPCQVFRGQVTQPNTWQASMSQLARWLQRLETPCGIIAVTDSRARHLLQACEHIGLLVPDQIAIIGIDDDEVVRNLNRTSLSSVQQGGVEIGFQAAKSLHRKLTGLDVPNTVHLIPPKGVATRDSTDFKALRDPYVVQAMHYIRNNACNGIKVDQVLDFVGVSRSNLEQRFTEERGHTLHVEIHLAKLNKACDLLTHTELSTSQIATICGYPSLQYMYAIFRKHFNTTPKDYRKSPDHDD